MITLKRLKQSKAARNAAASGFNFISIALVAFLSIPIAVHFLEREEIGLWAVVNQIVHYLLWMDLGIGSATGRKMADAIAKNDHPEINQWWTAALFALLVQGAVVVLVGISLMPSVLELFKVPIPRMNDATDLLVGSVILTGISFPMKGVPGLMIAQNRFYWIPLIQGLAPWFSLGVFAFLLNHGYGIRSYLWGMALAQLITWIAFSVLVHTSQQKPCWDSRGLKGGRFRSLFGFSLNLSGIALINAVISSIPAMLISRAGNIGGLGVIPQYNFTTKGPIMISNLVQRMNHSFYPGLQRLYVDGERDQFKFKFKQIGLLCVSFSLIAAGAVLTGTRLLVEILAGPEFYGGSSMTLWLAVGVVCIPLAALFQTLRQIAGSMGKTLLFSTLKLVVAIIAAFPCYRHFGLAGLAAVFMLVPLIDVGYGYFRGAISSGFQPSELSGKIMVTGLGALLLVLLVGGIGLYFPSIGMPVGLRSKIVHLPGWSECISGGVLSVLGAISALRLLSRLHTKKIWGTPIPDDSPT